MSAKKVNRFILVKNVLSAIAVVYIPIDNQYLANPMNGLGMAGGDSSMIKDTKSHSPSRAGMVTRWTGQAESTVD